MGDFSISFDPASLKEIANFAGIGVFMSEQVAGAMQEGGTLLVQAAQANTSTVFDNPTGQLSDSIVPITDSPYELQIQVGVPYGRRMEEGFYGSDSLGRVYAQAGKPYLQPALDDNQQQILQLFDDAVGRALGMLIAG